MAEEKKEIDYGKKLKEMQLQMLDKLGSGGLNQNDLMAIMGMMQKQEPNTFGDMMPMIMAMKMLNPTPKQDPATPMLLMYMLNSMKGSNGSDVNKKIEKLEDMIKAKEDKKMYEEVMKEIKDLQKSKEAVSIKDILALSMNKDKVIEDIKKIANDKDRELLITQFQSSIGGLQEEIKKLGSGGDISKMTQTMKAVQDFYESSGLKERTQKSKEEVIKDMVNSIATSFAPAVNKYVEATMSQRQQLTPAQQQRIQQIQAQRQNPVPANPAPNPEPAPEAPQEPYTDEDGNRVYPELIDISEGRATRKKR